MPTTCPGNTITVAILLLTGVTGCGESQTQFTDSPEHGSATNSSPANDLPVRIPEPYRIDVTGDDYQWHVTYPGPDGAPGTDDDLRSLRNVHIPVNTDVVLKLHSEDFIYGLTLPEYNQREIAVPELEFEMRFRATVPGQFELRGDQMCGYTHPQLLGQLIVQTRADFETWVRQTSAATDSKHRSPPRKTP